VFDTPGGYTQISKRFGSYRPYFRYQYLNAADKRTFVPGYSPGAARRWVCGTTLRIS